MIRRIVEADNEAKAMEEANLKEAEENKKKIQKEADKYYDKVMNEALETIKQNNMNEQAKTAKKLEEIERRQKSAFIKLKADFESNRDRWADEIVSRVIGE